MTFSEFNKKLDNAVEAYEGKLKQLKTGRPTPDMFNDIQVKAYGAMTNLASTANITVVDATLVTIQPWDKTLVEEIAGVLQSEDFGYNPSVDGQLIRVPIPMMTSEKRDEAVKRLHDEHEQARIQVRVIRKEMMNSIDQRLKDSDINEDQKKAEEKDVQTKIDKTNEQLEQMTSAKEAVLKQV